MNPAARLAVAVLFAMAAAPDAPPAGTLDRIMAALHGVDHIDARYVERRTLKALTVPIETRGTLRFDAPDHLTKISNPAPGHAGETLTIDHDRVTIDRGAGAAPVTLSIADHPEIGVLVDSIRQTLSGDGNALRRVFSIQVAGDVAGWQMVLQPLAHREIVEWMRITGQGGRLVEIDTKERDGDYAEMKIAETAP